MLPVWSAQTMSFWIRNIIIGSILIALAYYLLANQEELFSSSDSPSVSVTIEDDDKTSKPAPKKVKRKNAAAEGLSNFYANLQGTEEEDGIVIRNNIAYLPDPKGDIVKILEARRMVTRPLRKTWNGTKTSRPFRVGETMFQKLSQYANEDKLEVIWWLNRDFLVKDPFRINKNIIKTAYMIGEAIEGHFINGVETYFCYQQRALVLIDEGNDYLNEECIHLTPEYK